MISGPHPVTRDRYALTMRDGERLDARMTWEETATGAPRIDFLHVDPDAPAMTLPRMLAEFRRRYRERVIYFDADDGNAPMQRLIRLLNAEPTARSYRVQL